MKTGVDFGVPPGWLRHAVEHVDLGVNDPQRSAAPQGFKEDVGSWLCESTLGFLPDSLSDQRANLTGVRHSRHQVRGLFRDAKSQIRVTRGEPGETEDANRVFDEALRDVSEHACLDVALPSVGIDDLPFWGFRHRVDGEIATLEIIFKRHIRGELRSKAAVARGDLAL